MALRTVNAFNFPDLSASYVYDDVDAEIVSVNIVNNTSGDVKFRIRANHDALETAKDFMFEHTQPPGTLDYTLTPPQRRTFGLEEDPDRDISDPDYTPSLRGVVVEMTKG